MIRLAIRLTLIGGREAVTRLVITAVAVALGTCAPGAAVAAVNLQAGGSTHKAGSTRVWPAVSMPAARLGHLAASGIVVGTDGSAATIETARTIIETAFPFQSAPLTVYDTQGERLLAAWQQLANVVILAGLPIASCSLAVGVVAGLTDRKRPFSLLRLAGTPVGLLRRVVGLETGVPLLAVAVVSAALGLLVAELFLNSQLGLNLRPPGATYYGFVAGGVLLSLGDHRRDVPAAGPDHRAGGGQKRVTPERVTTAAATR